MEIPDFVSPLPLELLLAGGAILAAAPIGALVLGRFGGRAGRLALAVGSFGTAAGCLLGLAWTAAFVAFGGGALSQRLCSLPLGGLYLGLDRLSAFFLLVLFMVGLFASIHGHAWLRRRLATRRVDRAVALFGLLIASTALVLIARDGVLFLFGWEAMSLATFFLVAYEHGREEARRAAFVYLIASHVSLVFLMLLFGGLAAAANGDFAFSAFRVGGPGAGGLFVLALVGFGIKAGLWPGHVWLPDAYPVAPPHVASVMSGVLLGMGVYGLLRTLTFLGAPSPWWGGALLALGVASAVIGALLALSQVELTRLCAYSSVENLGIVMAAVGLWIVTQGQGREQETIGRYALCAGLIHLFNHALIKGLLFQAIGAIGDSAGTRRLDSLGGLARRMPWTAFSFFTGAVAISALPPLNGFFGEWVLLTAAFRAAGALSGWAAAATAAALAGLVLAGGLAAAGFVRAFGIAFLGTARSQGAAEAFERPGWERIAPLGAAIACVVLGLLPFVAVRLAWPVGQAPPVLEPIFGVAYLGWALVVLALGLVALRGLLLRRREVRRGAVWGCGYPLGTPRIQYTAASFAGPALAPFQTLLPRRVSAVAPEGFFPKEAKSEESYGDVAGERFVMPVIRRALDAIGRVRVFQHGHLHLYLLYILLTLIAFWFWATRSV